MKYRIIKKHEFEIYSIEGLFRSFFRRKWYWSRIGYWNTAHFFHFYRFDKKSDAQELIDKWRKNYTISKTEWKVY